MSMSQPTELAFVTNGVFARRLNMLEDNAAEQFLASARRARVRSSITLAVAALLVAAVFYVLSTVATDAMHRGMFLMGTIACVCGAVIGFVALWPFRPFPPGRRP